MPRSSRSSGGSRAAPARSAPAPARSAPAPQRQAAPAPAPVPAQQQHHSNVPAPHYPQQQGPGILGQVAANAASIAVGSTIARGLSGALFGHGGSSEQPQTVQDPSAAMAAAQQQQQQPGAFQSQQQTANSCEPIAKDFANCLSATNNDMTACQYYLEQFKACQAAAAPY